MSFILKNIRDMMKEQIKDKKKYNIVDSLLHDDDKIDEIINQPVKANEALPYKGKRDRN